jgi:hypothetical protein|tara:strand:+ start:4103 stop:5293 length:1191 start_codon:yes stop_codon:yes gene_type:complete
MLENDGVTYLLGNQTVSNRPLPPYDDLLCEFAGDLSSELRSHKNAEAHPDVMTFAFWCRKANISKLKANFADGKARLGFGLVFHITPSNVPVNFAFSFAFGFISGNANIVRVPTSPFPQVDIICEAIERLFEQDKYSEIKAMTAFLRYQRNDVLTNMLSANCNARIIWGGDEAIRNIRQSPMRERSVEIVFADRYSFCVMDASAVVKLDEDELKRLTEGFFNDTYLMDQNACSSPHLIIWLGDDVQAAKEKFWTAVARMTAKKYQLADINAVDKYTLLCRDAIELSDIVSVKKHGNDVYRVAINNLPDNMDTLRGKCGYFYEYDAANIDVLVHIINDKYQTITYFGVDKSLLLDFVIKNRLLGVDRIVPVGDALSVGVVWDGYDVVRSLSRVVDLR